MASKKEPKPHEEDFFETIAEEAIMGIMAFHLQDRHCVYVNSLAREILELSPDSVLEKFHIDHLKPKTPRDKLRNFSDNLLELEGLIRDVLMDKANGVPFVADLGIKIIESTDTLLLMFQDVTFQKKLQRELTAKQQEINSAYQELLLQNKQLRELDLAKDRFIALTTHELRTPLSAIVATSEVLKLKLFDTDEQRDEFIYTVWDQSVNLMTLVNDILDFTKIQAGKMDFFIQQEDLGEILNLTVSNFEQMAASAKSKLIYTKPTSPLLCYFDKVRLGEVLSNVINNAIKFNREDHEINISIKDENETYTIAITDHGVGIKEEHIAKVFNEFETIGNIETHHKGTGLGMPISKRIMDQMGGKIYLKSQINIGTTFFIEVPKTKVLDESEYRARDSEIDDLLNTV